MNVKTQWSNTFFIATTLAICLFVVVDITYNERIWEFGYFALKARLLSLVMVIVSFYMTSHIYQRIALSFININKNKNKSRASRREYALVFLINFISLNIIHLFSVYYITEMGFRWRESLLINVIGSVLLFLYYTMIRNQILFRNLVEQNLQLEKIKVDQLETELKFLKSQYHPHFLFNALNTIYFQINEENNDAKQSVEQLSALLRYQLYGIGKEVTMEQEIGYLKSYIAFQQQRTSDRLRLKTHFDPALKEQKIHPLLFQPLIENAFKHVRNAFEINIEMKAEANRVLLVVENTTAANSTNKKEEKGIGIENLKRRLDLLYPDNYSLNTTKKDNWYVAQLRININ